MRLLNSIKHRYETAPQRFAVAAMIWGSTSIRSGRRGALPSFSRPKLHEHRQVRWLCGGLRVDDPNLSRVAWASYRDFDIGVLVDNLPWASPQSRRWSDEYCFKPGSILDALTVSGTKPVFSSSPTSAWGRRARSARVQSALSCRRPS